MSRYLIPKGEKKQMKYVYERRKPKEPKRKLVTDTSMYKSGKEKLLLKLFGDDSSVDRRTRYFANQETNRIVKELFYSDKKDDKKDDKKHHCKW